MQEVVLVQACRTAFGNFGGALRSIPPVEMGAAVMQEVLGRSGVSALAVEQVVMGQVVLTEPQDIYLARAASMKAGVAHEAGCHECEPLMCIRFAGHYFGSASDCIG